MSLSSVSVELQPRACSRPRQGHPEPIGWAVSALLRPWL